MALEYSNKEGAVSVRTVGSETYRISSRYLVRFKAKRAGDKTWKGQATALVNPTTVKESIRPEYSKRPVLGLSHEVVQYIRTTSRVISMQLWVSYHIMLERAIVKSRSDILLMRNFFESLVVPSSQGLAPPLVAVYWPGADLHFKGVVESLSIEYQRFAADGMPMEYSLDLSFLEVADALMTSGPVFRSGMGAKAYGGDYPFGK
jgi:hypothetical protein